MYSDHGKGCCLETDQEARTPPTDSVLWSVFKNVMSLYYIYWIELTCNINVISILLRFNLEFEVPWEPKQLICLVKNDCLIIAGDRKSVV